MNNVLLNKIAAEANKYAFSIHPQRNMYNEPANPAAFQKTRELKLIELVVREAAQAMSDNDFEGSHLGNVILDHFGIII